MNLTIHPCHSAESRSLLQVIMKYVVLKMFPLFTVASILAFYHQDGFWLKECSREMKEGIDLRRKII